MDETAVSDVIKNIIERVFQIDDITIGGSKDSFLFRFRGRLLEEDTERTFFQLEEKLRSFQMAPLFRMEEGRHVILIVDNSKTPGESNPWINLLMFLLTVISVLLTGAFYNSETILTGDMAKDIPVILAKFTTLSLIKEGWPFAVSMLGILVAHEFGHYLMGRHYGIRMTLPYFIPLPFSPFGTMGAVINMKETPRNRRQLLDIGLAGPLAGLIVTIPVLFIGLKLSSLDTLPLINAGPTAETLSLEGNSIIYLFLKFVVFGKLLPAPVDFGQAGPVFYWLRYFFTSTPFPAGGTDVMLSSVAWAGWAGLLVTALNLIPAGQLDGGHILYVLIGKDRMRKLYPVLLVVLIGLGFVWPGWWFWAAILFLFGRLYAEPADQITPLDNKRKLLAILGLIIFLLVFIPVPITLPG